MEIRVLEIIAVREKEPEFRGSLCLLVDTRESSIRRCGFKEKAVPIDQIN